MMEKVNEMANDSMEVAEGLDGIVRKFKLEKDAKEVDDNIESKDGKV